MAAPGCGKKRKKNRNEEKQFGNGQLIKMTNVGLLSASEYRKKKQKSKFASRYGSNLTYKFIL